MSKWLGSIASLTVLGFIFAACSSHPMAGSSPRQPQNEASADSETRSAYDTQQMMQDHWQTFRNIMDATVEKNGLSKADEKYFNEKVLTRKDVSRDELDSIIKGLRMRSFILRQMDFFNTAQILVMQFDAEIDRLVKERKKNPKSSGLSDLREKLSAQLRVAQDWREANWEEMAFMYYHLVKASNEPKNKDYDAAKRILSKTAKTYHKECDVDASMCLAVYSVMLQLREVEEEYLAVNAQAVVPQMAKTFELTTPLYNKFLKALKSPNAVTAGRRKNSGLNFQEALDKWWVEFKQDEARAPQADPNLAVGPGSNGNITGRAFDKGTWAITMDDGPHKVHTLSIVESFRKNNMKGTFFWLSQNIPKLTTSVSAVKNAGHDIASHSFSHANLPKLDQAGLNHEIFEAADVFKASIGKAPTLFRCPYGACKPDSKIRQMIAQRGMLHAFWTVDTLDWQDKNPDVIFARTKKQMELDGRGMVLFHDIHLQSAQTIDMLLEWMRTKHPEWKEMPLSQIIQTQSGLKNFVSPAP